LTEEARAGEDDAIDDEDDDVELFVIELGILDTPELTLLLLLLLAFADNEELLLDELADVPGGADAPPVAADELEAEETAPVDGDDC